MDDKILRLPKVINKTGLPRSAIYNGMAEGTFPRSIQLTERTVGWIESEINRWIDLKIIRSRKSKGESQCQK